MKQFLLLLTIFLFWSCNNSETPTSSNTSTEDTTSNETSVSTSNAEEQQHFEYKEAFVAALSGLRMRKSPSLSGEKMDVVPFNTEILVNLDDKHTIKPVSGFHGSMVSVKHNGKKGYMFDGFLSRFPLPKKQQDLKTYVRKLKIAGFEASQTEHFEEITLTQTLKLPTTNFQEVFLIAQRFGWIIGKFDLPNPENPKKVFAVDKNNIKKTVKAIKLTSAQLEEDEDEIGSSINSYKYHFPFPNDKFSDFNMTFGSKDNTQWDTFQMVAIQEYFAQKTTIKRQGKSFLITYKETGE